MQSVWLQRAPLPCSHKRSTLSTSRGPARRVSRGRRRVRERAGQVARGTTSCSSILQLRGRLASQRRQEPGTLEAHTTPPRWEVPGAVLNMDRVLVGPLRIQTASTATERMQAPSGRGRLSLRPFSDLQDIPGALFLVAWSCWGFWPSDIHRCSSALSAKNFSARTPSSSARGPGEAVRQNGREEGFVEAVVS